MAAWLDLVSDHGGWSLIDGGRMAQVVQQMLDPVQQSPSLLFFLGTTTKAQALRALFPQNNITRRSRAGMVRLHVSATTVHTPHPVWILDGGGPTASRSGPSLAGVRHRIALDGHPSEEDLQHHCYARLLLPFLDVVCLFVDDLGGVDHVQGLLQTWTTVGARSAPAPPLRSQPRLILVQTGPEHGSISSALAELAASPQYRQCFAAAPIVVDLHRRHVLSPRALFEPLRTTLRSEVQQARSVREQQHWLFSAVHIDVLLRASLRGLGQPPRTVFNAVQAAREGNEVDDSLARHLRTFLELSAGANLSDPDIVAFIASALLLDGYPPGMHPFDPVFLFRELYAHHCHATWTTVAHPDPTERRQAVEKEFATLFLRLSERKRAAHIRREILVSRRQIWSRLLATTTSCLLCLRRPPDHALPCGHTLCDRCVSIFGAPARNAEYRFNLNDCLLCPQSFYCCVRILPPTKRPTLLVLDGGGVRGVVTLGFLRALEQQCGTLALRETVDLAVATSAGALILLDWILVGSTVQQALQKFKKLATSIFPAETGSRSHIARAWDLLISWLVDSRYDSAILDRTLQHAFGLQRRLFSSVSPRVAGTRVALTASRVSDGRLCLFTNYRGQSHTTQSTPYQLLRPQTTSPEPLLWEVARCSVAAPRYFQTYYLPGWGHFQDGGVRANNPLRAAVRESTRLWPAADRPDLMISIGTGYSPPPSQSEDQPSRGILRDGFIPRLLRSQILYSPATDGEQGWQEAHEELPSDLREDSFRLNRLLPHGMPDLDDSSRLDELSDGPFSIPPGLIRTWVAKLFYFELDDLPAESGGRLSCIGSIFCITAEPFRTVERAQTEFPGAHFAVDAGAQLARVDGDQGCRTCGYYRQQVTFDVSNLHERIALVIRGESSQCRLAGFPNCLRWFLDRQQAGAVFGRPDHRLSRWPPVRTCYCRSGRKRQIRFVEPSLSAKKPRLKTVTG